MTASAKPPDACRDLGDIRRGIDRIDREIVGLFKSRFAYVLAAAAFKPSEASIAAPERVAAMLDDRRAWMEDAGLPADGAEPLFLPMIQWFIGQQTRYWRARHRQGDRA